MNHLYRDLASVYEAMYKTFINYDEEFALYHGLLMKHHGKSVVEIGCGTGNLADKFTHKGFDYAGLDISEDMLAIARKNNPNVNFIQGSMTDFTLPKQVSSAIMTGRTISYLITNTEVLDCFRCIHRNLTPSGILCFDFIDANAFIPAISKEPVQHDAVVDGTNYQRDSFWSVNLKENWTFDWRSEFYRYDEHGNRSKIGEDHSTIRAFTKDDILLFLELAQFNVKEIIPRKTYAFDTFVVVAQK